MLAAIVTIKYLFSMIDYFVYELMTLVYSLIEKIAFVNIFSSGVINEFSMRIYSILGIFMLFKISFSFINYLVDPDKFLDKQTGFSKMIVNVILAFVLLMAVPWAFTVLNNVQSAILEEHVLSNLILGVNDSEEVGLKKIKWSPYCEGELSVGDNGEYLAMMIYRPFLQYNKRYLERENDIENNGVLCKWANGQFDSEIVTAEYNSNNIENMTSDTIILEDSENSGASINIVRSFASVASGSAALDAFSTSSFVFQVNYIFIISTIAGVAVIGLLISFGLDIAVRSIKLAFLQLLAPIPIISFMDPDKSKHKLFNNWLKDVGTTWFSLFLRIGALYLIIYILDIMTRINFNEFNIDSGYVFWVELFFIIGALIFAKKLPSWLESLTGIKFDGGMFEINPLKKIKNEALGGKQLVNGAMGAVGAGVGLIGSAAAHGLAYNANRKKFNEENSKLNEIKGNARNSRLQGIQNYRNARDARNRLVDMKNRKEDIKKQMDELDGRINSVAASGRDPSALRKQYNNLAGQYHRINVTDADIQTKTDEMNSARRAALENAKIEKQKIAEQQEKVNEIAKKPILKNPIGSAAGEIARGLAGGAKNAYQADTLNVGKIVSAGLKGTDEAAMKRNYREDFSIRDEFHDRMTSFARIKNESGTSSEIDKEIKKLRSEMTREMNTLNQLNNTIANLSNSVSSGKQAEAIRITSGNKDDFVSKYKSYDDYKSRNSNTTLDKEDFDKLYEAMSAWVKTQKSIDSHEKNIKKYEKMQESQNKRGRE